MTLDPDPSVIGGIARAAFALPPDPGRLFARRAERFAFLAGSGALAPYLSFLAGLSRVQDGLAQDLTPPDPVPEAQLARARAGRMPPIDRRAMAGAPAMAAALDRLLTEAGTLDMPEPARLALDAVQAADAETRTWLLGNVLSDAISDDMAAPHLFVAAATQVVMAQAAAGLDAERLVAVAVGACPACGGRPVTSSVVEMQGMEGVRYATCACCATEWNEVRVKCLCCGSTKGVGYRGLEGAEAGDPAPAGGLRALAAEATVKAEVCDECHSWVKILYRNRNPSMDPVADDVASLGLDLRMRETEWRRGGANPWLVGY